jgi:hypothetical protein
MRLTKKPNDSISLQERDIALLKNLFECRVMTTDHATELFFDGRSEAAKKRLQKIKAAGLIGERPRRAFEPSILFLTRKGLDALHKHGILAQYPAFDLPALERRARVSNLTIQHELAVMDVKMAFHSAITTTPSFTIAEFSTWPLLNEFKAYRSGHNGAEILVKPDGFISIHEKEAGTKGFAHEFFLEVDRSTETQDVLITRAGCYFDYYKSGGFAAHNGAARSAYKEYPFRVLFVFKNAERRNNMAERLLQNNPPILTQVVLSTFDEVLTNPLGAIWTCARDYRDAVKGTAFEVKHHQEKFGYQRQTAREIFIEKNVRKFRLLAEDHKK